MSSKSKKASVKTNPKVKQDTALAEQSRRVLQAFIDNIGIHRGEMIHTETIDILGNGQPTEIDQFFAEVITLLFTYRENICDDDGLFKKTIIPGEETLRVELPERDFALSVSQVFKEWAAYKARKAKNKRLSNSYLQKYWEFMRFEAHDWLDSYCIYIEKDMPEHEKLYTPRRNTLLEVALMLQDAEDDKLDECFIHMPPRVGKTLIVSMGMSWHCSRNPKTSNLYITFKESLGASFLDGVKQFWTDTTYCHMDVFPDTEIVYTDAKNNKVDLAPPRKYKSLSGKGVEAGLNGEYDANGWMVVDDPLEGIQDVLNPEVLNNKKTIFTNNAKSRAKRKCKMIFMGTIWDVNDIFMTRRNFLQNTVEGRKKRFKVLCIPALNENEESNFAYDFDLGYTTDDYKAIRAEFEENNDLASWFCQYQQDPKARGEALFEPKSIHTYDGILPEEPPLKIISACDVALGGEDYLSMPIAYVYEDGRVYIPEVVYDNSEKHVTLPKVCETIYKHGVTNAHFEANAGGEAYAEDVERTLREQYDYKINVVAKYAIQMIDVVGRQANTKTDLRKQQRIFNNAQQIRQFYFLEPSIRPLEYRKFMNGLFGFTMNNRNRHKHDDAPDSLAMLSVYINNGSGVRPPMRYISRRR